MRSFLIALALLVLSGPSLRAQRLKSDAEFAKTKPAVGDVVPDVAVYDPSGKEVKLSSLRGSYVVLTFGCMT